MVIRLPEWKAPWIRLILIMGAFFVFSPGLYAQYHFNENCQQAYESILSLRFSEATRLLAVEKRSVPDNLVPVYLENFIDFLTLVIGEESAAYDYLKDKKYDRIKKLEKGRKDSPYYNFCLGEVHLQWALAKLKFGDYASAAVEMHEANELFLANEVKYPSFTINKMGLGVIQVVVSLVPDKYKWIGRLVGLNGSMEVGINEIRRVAEYSGQDKITRMYKPEASFFLVFLVLNLQKNKKDALPLLQLLNTQSSGKFMTHSPLLIYARASVLMKNGMNEEALTVLNERLNQGQTFPFYYLDYLEGLARLNKLDYSAAMCFEKFLTGFRGKNYFASSYQKLGWIALLCGDSVRYRQMIHNVVRRGTAIVDEDKQALFEATQGIQPNSILLRARLLFDGGYYNLAFNELLNNPTKTTIKSKRDLVEYTYRLGRIYHETGNYNKALENYQQTIARGLAEPFYFAAGAALQMGLLYENRGNFQDAEIAYKLCLSINTPEYRTSLHQKAKAGLSRLKSTNTKT